MKTTFVILLTIFALSNALDLPKNLKPCRKSNPNYGRCLNDVVTPFIKSLAPGVRSLNILPLEPLAINELKIGENSGAVAVKQDYKNVQIHGLTKGLTLQNYRMDFDRLIIYAEANNPRVDFVADYSLNGRVLILPIHGKGRSNITLVNLDVTNTMYCETYLKDGETYLRIKNYVVKFNPERVIMHFGNLFDGDRALGDRLNMFLNENSEMVFKELQGSFEETFGLVFANIGNNVLSRYPMRILFPE